MLCGLYHVIIFISSSLSLFSSGYGEDVVFVLERLSEVYI